MERINACNSSNHYSVTSLPQANEKEKNERIANSFITKLEACHYPDDAQRKTLSALLEKFPRSDSINEVLAIKKEISKELESLLAEIRAMRGQVFSIEKKYTDQVYGMLNEGFTTNDRDQYIKNLMYYREVGKKVMEITGNCYEGSFSVEVPALASHHSHPLWGDMGALERLINGKSARLPDLTYNVGRLVCS